MAIKVQSRIVLVVTRVKEKRKDYWIKIHILTHILLS